jgi:hypothetical protein
MLRLMHRDICAALPGISVWTYRVHGRNAASARTRKLHTQSAAEAARKLAAIRCHKSQLMLSRRRFLGYASRPESFRRIETADSFANAHHIQSFEDPGAAFRLNLRLPFRAFPSTPLRLSIVGYDPAGRPRTLVAQLPAQSRSVDLFDAATQRCIGSFVYTGDAFAGSCAVPLQLFASTGPVFVMIGRSGLLHRTEWTEFKLTHIPARVPVANFPSAAVLTVASPD